jgi:hypothetical protein
VAPVRVDDFLGGHDVDPPAAASYERVRSLESRVENLQRALHSQRQIGTAIGIIACRLGCSSDEAWLVMVRLSQHANVKVRVLARVIQDGVDGRLGPDDQPLLAALASHLPELVRLPTEDPPVPRAAPVPILSEGG